MELKKVLFTATLTASALLMYGQSSLTSGEHVVQPGRHDTVSASGTTKKAVTNRYNKNQRPVNAAYHASEPNEKPQKTYHVEQYKGFNIKVADGEPSSAPASSPAPSANATPASAPIEKPVQRAVNPAASVAAASAATSKPAPEIVLMAKEDMLSTDGDIVLRAEDFNMYLDCAGKGDTEAMRRAGLCYLYGTGVASNSKKALEWLGKAAHHENTESQYDLGVMFRDGIGVRQNLSDASFWLRKAARNGHAKAQLATGLLFLEGKGVQQDSRIAGENFWRAAEQGNIEAAYRLACMYRDGVGMTKNQGKAYHYFNVAASKGEYKDAAEQAKKLKQYAPASKQLAKKKRHR